ncbi:MAG: DUF4270 family protein [Bacteroidetes bacterium]|jgi:hypothetical protein|nr:DUF4270 family protein [Bacteroidota bacterium]
MKWRFPLLAVLLVSTLVATTACEDPSSVGLDLVGDGATPRTDTLTVDAVTALNRASVTGNTNRILVGTVDDPVLGVMEAQGYINFTRSEDDLTSPTAPVDSVFLAFEPGYIYGDTAAVLTLELFDIETDEQWSAQGARSDTSLTTGDVITSTTFAAADTLVTVRLPSSWIAANEDVLVADPAAFNEAFRGFKLTANREAAGAIVGAGQQGLLLSIFSQGRRTEVSPQSSITNLERRGGGTLPADRVLLQDGFAPSEDLNVPNSAFFAIDFSVASLPETALNGSDLRLFADTTTFAATPPGFVRPRPDDLRLVAVDTDGNVVFDDEQGRVTAFEAPVFFTADGQLRFREPATNSARSLRRYVQEARLDALPDAVAGLELRFPTSRNTINPIVLYGPTAPADVLPRLYVTFPTE